MQYSCHLYKNKVDNGKNFFSSKYKTKSKINPLDFFSRLSNTNLAPEAYG